MTKKQAKQQKAEWQKALSEGRVVRWNGGITLTSYPTAAEALMRCAQFNKVTGDASIVVYPPQQ